MLRAARPPITRPSSREFDASRFAPCRPVRATSPTAYSPGTVVRPARSVHTPPQLVVRRRRHRQQVAVRVDSRAARAGGRDGREPAGEVGYRSRAVQEHVVCCAAGLGQPTGHGQRRPHPAGRGRRAGARRPSSGVPAPSTQHGAGAAERLGDQRRAGRVPGRSTARSDGTARTPGRRPPRRPAEPSPARRPVATAGLVLAAYSWPEPPVASTTALARGPGRAGPVRVEHAEADDPCRRPVSATSTARWPVEHRRQPGGRAESARCTSAPVASPPACTIRSPECPPSRVRSGTPSGPASNAAPRRLQPGDRGRVPSARMPARRSRRTARRRRRGCRRVCALARRRRRGSGADHGDAALGPAGAGVADVALGDHQHGQAVGGGVQRAGQAGDAGADDDDVGRRPPSRSSLAAAGLPMAIIASTAPRAAPRRSPDRR